MNYAIRRFQIFRFVTNFCTHSLLLYFFRLANTKLRLRLPAFTRNFYFITSLVFITWMLFLDANDFLSQFRLWQEVKGLEAKKEYYQEKIEVVKKERTELMSNKQLLEKFAREKYLMKKQKEEVFVVVEEGKEKEVTEE